MTDYYIDANRGSDVNNGTSKNTAWASLEAIRTKALTGTIAAGDNFLFESSSEFIVSRYLRLGSGFEPLTYINGSSENLITFDKYDYSSAYSGKPEFTYEYTPDNEDWVFDAAKSLWYYPHPTPYTTQLNWGIWPHVTINGVIAKITRTQSPTFIRGAWPNAYGEVASWFASNPGRLYAWTPSATSDPLTNPYNVYGPSAIRVGTYAVGVFTFARCGSYVNVNNLATRGGSQLVQLYQDSSGAGDIESFKISRCNAFSSSSLITLAMLDKTTFYMANNPIIEDCYAEHLPGGAIQGGGKNLLIRRNVVKGANYSRNEGGGFYLVGNDVGMSVIAEDNTLSDCRYESGLSTGDLDGGGSMASDGCAIYVEAGTLSATIRRNNVFDCPLALQDNSGKSTLWNSNYIRNCDKGITITDQSNYGTTPMTVKLYGNTFHNMTTNALYNMSDTRKTVIACRRGTPAAVNYTYDFRNNLLHGIGESLISGRGMLIEAGTNFTYLNNAVYGFETVKATEYVYTDKTTPATTITSDPLVRTDGAVSLGSPCIKAGISTGLTLTDFENNLFGITPTVGAFEFNAFRDIEGIFE